jgi:hypothetical protein
MSQDIYSILLSQGFLNRECDLEKKRDSRKKAKNRLKVMKKILYDDISSGSEEEILTASQTNNNLYIDSVIKINQNDYIDYLKDKFDIELEEYFFINDKNINEMKTGGYIRCVNMNEDIKWGGILVNIKNEKKITKMKLVLKNCTNNYWNIKFNNFYVFYKKNVSKYDKFRDLFISKAHLNF